MVRVSVIVPVDHCRLDLEPLLWRLRAQTLPPLEVIVAPVVRAGIRAESLPSAFAGQVQVLANPCANAAQARNAAVARARGDLVAFLEMEALPDAHWLERLMAGYTGEHVGGVSGLVLDGTGAQVGPMLRDRRFQLRENVPPPYWHYVQPRGELFLSFQDAYSFRRQALAAVGGFDEAIQSGLAVADACLRLTDQGHVLRLVPSAMALRSTPLGPPLALAEALDSVQDQFYGALQTVRPGDSITAVLTQCRRFAQSLGARAQQAWADGYASSLELVAQQAAIQRGVRLGIRSGLFGTRRLAPAATSPPEPWQSFARPAADEQPLTIGIVAQERPGKLEGETLSWRRFAALAATAGHDVHLFVGAAEGDSLGCTTCSAGVWVHRLRADEHGPWRIPTLDPPLRRILGRAAATHRAITRLTADRWVDVVIVSLADLSGFFCLLDDSLVTLLSLDGSLHVADEPAQGWDTKESQQRQALERAMIGAARFVHASSSATLARLDWAYPLPVDLATAFVVPSGRQSLPEMLEAVRTIQNRVLAA